MNNNKNKSNAQWYKEWAISFVVFVVLTTITFIVTTQINGVIHFFPLTILSIFTFITFVVFLVRTFGIVLLILFPEKKGMQINFTNEAVSILKADGNTDTFPWNTIIRIILSENFDGIFINSNSKKETYALTLRYKDLENMIDNILRSNPNIQLKKDEQWVHSNQEGLDQNKNPEGVKRTYWSSRVPRIAMSQNGVSVISYTRLGEEGVLDKYKNTIYSPEIDLQKEFGVNN